HTSTIDRQRVEKEVEEVEWDLDMIEKGGFPHYMLKEIYEQPDSVRNAMRGRLQASEGLARLGGLNLSHEEPGEGKRDRLTACGTSWHAGLIGEYLIEEHARIPVEVEYASEFRYRNPVLDEGTLVLVISQSGETADTLAAMREAKRKGARALGIVNAVGSTIARESDGGVYIHAGPEIGVASTKAFTSQVTVLSLLALHLARLRTMSRESGVAMAGAVARVPGQIQAHPEGAGRAREIAQPDHRPNHILSPGRAVAFP